MGMTFEKMMLLAFVAVLIMGPKNLPRYAQWLGATVRKVRAQWQSTKSGLKDELGVDGSDIDWKQLDPRQYDPRRIIREALRDSPNPAPSPHAQPQPTPAPSPLTPPPGQADAPISATDVSQPATESNGAMSANAAEPAAALSAAQQSVEERRVSTSLPKPSDTDSDSHPPARDPHTTD